MLFTFHSKTRPKALVYLHKWWEVWGQIILKTLFMLVTGSTKIEEERNLQCVWFQTHFYFPCNISKLNVFIPLNFNKTVPALMIQTSVWGWPHGMHGAIDLANVTEQAPSIPLLLCVPHIEFQSSSFSYIYPQKINRLNFGYVDKLYLRADQRRNV